MGPVSAYSLSLPARSGRPSGLDGRQARPSGLEVWTAGFISNRAELVAQAGLPPAASDADLLSTLFREHGAEAAGRIHGPFAWVLSDARTGRLWAARDRAGAVGIYYGVAGNEVLVGARLEQVRAHVAPVSPSMRSLVALLHGQPPPPGETCFSGVRALEPGALLRVSEGAARVEPYWRLGERPPLELSSDAEFAEAFRELLVEVAAGYRPEEPSAVALSSGLDSTTVAAALAAGPLGGPISLVTCGMPEIPASDESSGARAAAQHLGLPLEVVRADRLWPLSSGGPRSLPEGPLTAYRELWEALFERSRSRGRRRLFTGISGDHLLGGTGVLVYPDLLLSGRWRLLAARLAEHRRRSGRSLAFLLYRRLLRPLLRAQMPSRWSRSRSMLPWLGSRGRAVLRQALPAEDDRWRRLPGRRSRLYSLRHANLPHTLALLGAFAAEHGVELCHPLTDHRLLEFAAALPLDQCLRAGVPKYLLRTAMRGLLPPEILDNPNRVYPHALLERGLREREQAKVWELISGMRAAEIGLVDEGLLQEAYRRYLAGAGGTLFWHTLAVEDWLRRYA